jgi:predicted amidohydrolase
VVGPKGFIGCYRKTHLFFEETLWFTPGDSGFQVWDIGMAKVGVMICFDWYYPESARTLALQGADIIAHPSNLVLPTLSGFHGDPLLGESSLQRDGESDRQRSARGERTG